jgi:hypothetical protein
MVLRKYSIVENLKKGNFGHDERVVSHIAFNTEVKIDIETEKKRIYDKLKKYFPEFALPVDFIMHDKLPMDISSLKLDRASLSQFPLK